MATQTRAGGGRHRAARTESFAAGPKNQRRKRGFFRRWWWVFVAVPLVLIGLFAAAFAYAYARTTIPSAPPQPQTTYVYDRHGRLLGTLHAGVNRTEISLQQMPQYLRDGVIAVEDRNFYHEGGISVIGTMRAAWVDVTHGSTLQGGSTITQQYVKQVYTGSERTFARKIKEAILAMKISKVYSKNQILEKYLNTVYFGQGAYGAQAAAETYWGVPASKLDLLQSATLAGVIQAPSTYDPVLHPDQARARRNLVLALMAQQGYITESTATSLMAEPVKLHLHSSSTTFTTAPYFMSYVSQQLQRDLGSQLTFGGGLKVTTSLDLGMQRDAERAVAAHLTNPKGPSAALVAIDPATGGIRAMVGGRNFHKSQFNLAVDGPGRQAGSSFKAFTLAAAFQERVSPNSTWNGPSVITIPDPQCYTNGGPWVVHNYADESGGTMSLVNATANSVNTIFAQLVVDVGPQNVVDVAKAMGITTDIKPVCSITLGTEPVHPMDMADAYATLAAQGIHRSPIAIQVAKDPSGTTLLKPDTTGTRALAANDANMVTYALQRVVTSGTGTAAAIGRPVAGKTGTASGFVDAWFCGYTPQLAACVWVGYPKNETTGLYNVDGFPEVFGGSVPALIWHDFMQSALANQPIQGFVSPSFGGFTVNPPGSQQPVTPSPSPSPTGTVSPTPSESPSPSPTESPTGSPSPSPTQSALVVFGLPGLLALATSAVRRRRRRAHAPPPHRRAGRGTR
ncbi:MAG TPA: PBP1A family penicillin-binding protein [Actinomycetota bacterium]